MPNRRMADVFLVPLFATLLVCRCVAQRTGTAQAPTDDLARAKEALDLGHYDGSEKLLRDYLARYPSDAEARYLLAYTLFKEDKPADSLNEYTAAAKMRAPLAPDLRTVALDYVLLNDYIDAEHWIHSALSFDPSDGESWYALGRIEYTLNHFPQAVDAFQRSLQLDPASVKAENNLGLAFEGLNKIDEALACYRKAVAMQSGTKLPSEQPMLNLATLLIDGNQLDQALPLLKQAAQIAPRDCKVLAQLGRLYMEEGNLGPARDALEQAVAIEPRKAALHFQLGQVYRKNGDSEKAKQEFATAQSLLGTASNSPQ